MDDEQLNAARRRGKVRRMLWPHGKTQRQKGFMYGRRWIGVALVLLVCALTVVGIVVLSGGQTETEPPSKGNSGVLSLYDFFREYAQNMELQNSGPLKDITERLMREPFEINAKLELESQGLKSFGMPFTSVPADLNIKYDLRDVGVKADVIGMDIFGAYVIGDQLVIDSANEDPTVSDLPAQSDVSGDMTLGNRIRAFVPYMPEDAAMFEQMFGALAQSVPEECTQMQLARAYSPMDDADVNVTVVNTALDAKALGETAAAFSAKLEEDEALYQESQKLISGISAMLGLKDLTLDSLLSQLQNQDFEAVTVTCKVFRRDESPIGFAVVITNANTQYDFTRMAEFEGKTSHERTVLLINGNEVFSADYSFQAEEKTGVLSAVLHSADGETISIDGTFEIDQYTANSYGLTADIAASGKLFGDETDTVHAAIDAHIDIGNGLGTLKDSRGWQDIYEQEWKESAPS